MLPMITSYSEIIAAREILDYCRVRVEEERQQAVVVPMGIMIETPAAAVMSDVLSKYVDFVSIGTNDLTQYTLAADRTNELVSNMFDCIHPSVIRLMKMIIESADKYCIEVSVCGEMAAQVAATDILLGIGVRHLSVAPHVVPELQRRIQSLGIESCRQLVDQLAECRTSSDVRAMILEHQSQEQRSL
jgi:phosphotransferase system enzyme I (PtsI)